MEKPVENESKKPGLFLLVIRSALVHLVVWLLVLVLGPICIVMSFIIDGRAILWAAYIFSWTTLKVAGVKVVVKGRDYAAKDRTQVIAANHASSFDVYAMVIALSGYDYRIISKREFKYLPIFGWALWAGGFPFVDRRHPTRAHKTMNGVADKIRRTGISILAFPEGTRNPGETLMPFKKGIFLVAIRAQLPVLPVAITGARKTQRRNAYLVHPGVITVTFLPPVPTDGLTYDDRNELIERVRSSIVANIEGCRG